MKQRIQKLVAEYKNSPFIKLIGALILIYFLRNIYVWSTTESTDNAYIDADISTISAEISGPVTKVNVSDNMLVKEGDIIAEIDDRDYQSNFARATASYEAGVNRINLIDQKTQIEEINLKKNKEALELAKTNFDTASLDFSRTSNLSRDNFASQKALDNAKSTYEKAKTEYSQSKLNVKLAEQNLLMLAIEKLTEESGTKALLQEKNLGERKLFNTKIRSPINGVVAGSGIRIGNYARPGIPLFLIIPNNKLYIKANFKETQVRNLKAGMKATIIFDALGKDITGTIRSISPATGSKFSLIPPDNATGNFTKIVQRVPVLIDFELTEKDSSNIVPGMSAIVKIRTNQ